MRKISKIIIHCTATPRGRHVTVDEIRAIHVGQNGWNDVGYHYVVYLDGSVHVGRPEEEVGAHCRGHNSESIGVAYVGGVEADGRAADTRTPRQKESLKRLVESLQTKYPGATVHGHNEFAAKACPSFNVRTEFGMIVAIFTLMLMSACGSVKKTVETQAQSFESVDLVRNDKSVMMLDLVEFSDLVMMIDSVEIERRDDDNRLTKVKTGPIAVKLKREMRSSATGEDESHTTVEKESVTSVVDITKTDGRPWTIKMLYFLIVVVVVIGCIIKMVKK